MTVSTPLLVPAATIAVAAVWLTVIAVRRQVVLAGVAGVLGLAGIAFATARGRATASRMPPWRSRWCFMNAALLGLGQELESLLEHPPDDGTHRTRSRSSRWGAASRAARASSAVAKPLTRPPSSRAVRGGLTHLVSPLRFLRVARWWWRGQAGRAAHVGLGVDEPLGWHLGCGVGVGFVERLGLE